MTHQQQVMVERVDELERMIVERTRTIEVTAFLVGLGALLMAISAFCSVLWFNRVI